VLRRFAGQGTDLSEEAPVLGKQPRPALSGCSGRTTLQIPRTWAVPNAPPPMAAWKSAYRATSRAATAASLKPQWLRSWARSARAGAVLIACAVDQAGLLGPLQQQADGGGEPLHVAPRRSYAHLLQPGCNALRRQVEIGVAHPRSPAGDRQASARRTLEFLGGQSVWRRASAARCAMLARASLEHAREIILGHIGTGAARQRQPSLGGGLEVAQTALFTRTQA
jgi:hypothetical protein